MLAAIYVLRPSIHHYPGGRTDRWRRWRSLLPLLSACQSSSQQNGENPWRRSPTESIPECHTFSPSIFANRWMAVLSQAAKLSPVVNCSSQYWFFPLRLFTLTRDRLLCHSRLTAFPAVQS